MALLGVSILIENRTVARHCWQTSISAYYYTPVRAVFVGAMLTVGFALIVIKGRNSFEDVCLNFAGMLAPVVAVAPTTDWGTCWSTAPKPLPKDEYGAVAEWVVTNINNNFYALLIAGAVGLLVAAVIALFANQGVGTTIENVGRGTLWSLAATAGALLVGWALIERWDGFHSGMHGPSAIAMFVFLIGAVGSRAWAYRGEWRVSWYFRLYLMVGLLMALGGLAIWLSRVFEDHTVFALEAYEIVLFAAFWLVQTKEHWDEEPCVPATP
ncbi:MAG TPA: hypothetical protein VG408_06025 [Actinomycetota bacterium]|nr:hypothetical protein [Actinomycetota bacterium]